MGTLYKCQSEGEIPLEKICFNFILPMAEHQKLNRKITETEHLKWLQMHIFMIVTLQYLYILLNNKIHVNYYIIHYTVYFFIYQLSLPNYILSCAFYVAIFHMDLSCDVCILYL